MADDQQFCLRWNDFQANMVASFKHLRDEKSFCDVTIATEVLKKEKTDCDADGFKAFHVFVGSAH